MCSSHFDCTVIFPDLQEVKTTASYVYSKQVSDPMLSYRFNASHVLCTGQDSMLPVFMRNPSTHKCTRTTHTHNHTHKLHAHTTHHTHTNTHHTHVHIYIHTQPDLSKNGVADSQQPKPNELVSSVCWQKLMHSLKSPTGSLQTLNI